jgi:hypothetical protein
MKVKHLKRGSVYEVLGEGKIQTKSLLVDYDEVVVYQGEDGQIWVRPKTEFGDGRFVEILDEIPKYSHRCPECGEFHENCDPDGVGHYRG